MFSPLEQFKIISFLRIFNNWIDLSITNSTFYLFFSILIILALVGGSTLNNKLVSNKLNYMFEVLYTKIEDIVSDIIGKKYNHYIPFAISIFLFILFNNIIGLVPYSFTTTSHIIITLTMSLTIIIGITLIGFMRHSLKFFTLFVPNGLNQGATKFILPLIVFIEIISYISRIISLSIRLTANLTSGHTLLKIIANFGLKYTYFYPYILLILPLIVLSLLFLLEIGVSLIQAYVFTLLTLTYIKDVELLH